jgi:hypothetical protein
MSPHKIPQVGFIATSTFAGFFSSYDPYGGFVRAMTLSVAQSGAHNDFMLTLQMAH